MEYALSNTHWLDVFTAPVERRMEGLARAVLTMLREPDPAARPGAKIASNQDRGAGRIAQQPLTEPDLAAPTARQGLPHSWPLALVGGLFALVATGIIVTMLNRGTPPSSAPAQPLSSPMPAVTRRRDINPPSSPPAQPVTTRGDRDSSPPPKSVTNSIGMTLKLIPAGEFDMGSSPEELDLLLRQFPTAPGEALAGEQPRHRVRITRPFYLGATEVTRGQFRRFVESENYQTVSELNGKGAGGIEPAKEFQVTVAPRYSWRNTGYPQTDDHPVVNLLWDDAVAFCAWLTRTEGVVYRLPTEAEWEYACRAGTTSLYTTGNEPESLVYVGNIQDASLRERYPAYEASHLNLPPLRGDDGYVFTAPVGQFRPNPFGLFDMIGNVSELCSDRFEADFYSHSPANDPVGPPQGPFRAQRGGSWPAPPAFARAAPRAATANDFPRPWIGFRVARNVSGRRSS
jgi:formylglycine-generating enzyme required for sulfatase activity